LAETSRRDAIYVTAIDRLAASPFNKIPHVPVIIKAAAAEARIDLILAALELERHEEIHFRDSAPVAA
jgi:hypothetical protein